MIKKPLSLYRASPLREEPGLGALSLPGYLREVTTRYREREAVVMYRGEEAERWSYNDLWQRSVEVAKALIACGVGKNSRVGILMTNRAEYLSSLFGTALAGGVAVVFSTFSTRDELQHLLAVSDVSLLLYEDRVLTKDFTALLIELEPQIAAIRAGELRSPQYPYLQRLVSLTGITAQGPAGLNPALIGGIDSWETFIACGASVPTEMVERRAKAVHPADDAGLFFSSGTTSLPKGILHAQRAFAVQLWRWPRLWGLTEPARSWTGNGFFWAGPMTIIVGTALSTGGTIVLQPLFDAGQALRLIEKEKVTLMNGRPHQWARLQAAEGWARADLSSLRQVTKGELIMEHPSVNLDWEMPNAFGTTETMSILTSFTAGAAENVDPTNVGPALPGNVLKIVDPLSGAIMPLGERGEVCVKGPTLMKGYLGKAPEDVFDEDGYYHTGDGGYLDEQGYLIWEGRLNDIIKTGGANVSPEEVDAVLGNYPGVKRTQTVGVPHETLSEMVVSCVVPVEGAQLQEQAIVQHLKARLASYKVPRRILFCTEDEFSLTGNEKVKASDIRQIAVQRLNS